MNTQPVEILYIILRNLTNLELNRCRIICRKWKNIIENQIFSTSSPTRHDCIILSDYYHFGKLHINETNTEYLICRKIAELKNDAVFLKRYSKPRLLILNPGTIQTRPTLTVEKSPSMIDLLKILIIHNDVNTVGYIIQSNHPDFCNHTTYKETAFIWAAEKGNLSIGKLLLQSGIDHNALTYKRNSLRGLSSLMVIKFMIELGLDINYDKKMALYESICEVHDIELVKFFTKQGADILSLNIQKIQEIAPYHHDFLQQLMNLGLLY